MSEAAKRDEGRELTPEEVARLRRLLRLIDHGADLGDVDERKPVKVAKDREPPPEAFEDVMRRRKRRGHGA